jgi:hypothetical protein
MDAEESKLQEGSARVLCAFCVDDGRWNRRHSVHDKPARRRTWLSAHGSKVRGPCALCDGADERVVLHACDGQWQACHDVASARGGSADYHNLRPGHGGCNQQQKDSHMSEFRQKCGLASKPVFGGFVGFSKDVFDKLDRQLGSVKAKAGSIKRSLAVLNTPKRDIRDQQLPL